MFSRIGTKVLVLFVFNVIVWVSLLGIFFYWIAAKSLEEQVDSSLKATATVLASQWDGSLLIPLKPGMEQAALYRSFSERLTRMKQTTQLEGIYIAAMDRTNIVSSDHSLRIGQPLPRLDLLQHELQQTKSGSVTASRLIHVNDRDYKSALAPVYSGNRVAAVLMVDMSPQYLVYLKSFRSSLMLFTIIALLCCVLSARYFSRSITTPLSQIVERVEEIGKARYERPLQVSGTDELAQLAGSIETMRQNILHRDLQMKMMLSGIAHEIRNPLGGMELFTGILEQENLDSKQIEYVKKIKSEIQNLKQLLNEFLEFAGPKKLECEKVYVADLMSEIQDLLSEEIQQKKASWQVQIQPELDVIRADRFKLKQALLNLYRNAFQALPVTGEVSSRLRKNGTGIIMEISNSQSARVREEILEKIFEPFFTTKEKGIGLGLPLAKRIIEAHGGKLQCSENTNSHITFAIHLPGN